MTNKECGQDEVCSGCSSAASCSSRPESASTKVESSPFNQVKHLVAVMSGKGGVGKSTVSALLASNLAKAGYQVGILDADITGPSIPRLFGLTGKPDMDEKGLLPVTSSLGIKVMSLNLLLPEETEPVVWRGPLIGAAIKQFWTDVVWGELDFLVVDLPPGTSDAALTVLQSLPVTGVIMVSTPQDLATMIVGKAVKMVEKVGIPMIGLVENMSYTLCPHCSEEIRLFGPSKAEEFAESIGTDLLAVLPIDHNLIALADSGNIEKYDAPLNKMVNAVTTKLGMHKNVP
ncbi:MAG TPA: Mrp/NBP35 family ATP-binding protein [Clostridia bacterium]|nr:Mrp/NBP35 family ATP-binding protein [Clostridia bacterium]